MKIRYLFLIIAILNFIDEDVMSCNNTVDDFENILTTIDHLPNEILQKIFSELESKDLCSSAVVCQDWFSDTQQLRDNQKLEHQKKTTADQTAKRIAKHLEFIKQQNLKQQNDQRGILRSLKWSTNDVYVIPLNLFPCL